MEKLLDIVAEVLNVDRSKIALDTLRDEMPSWDSFNHIRLIAEAEEQLNIKIPFEKIPEIKKISDILDFI
jgi:acyl carrier protein